MRGKGGAHHMDRHGRPRSLSQPHVQAQQGLEPEMGQQPRVTAFGRTVRGKAMVDESRLGGDKRRYRRASDEAVQEDRNALQPCGKDGASDRGDLPSPQPAQGFERRIAVRRMKRQCQRHGIGLARDALIVDPGSPPAPRP